MVGYRSVPRSSPNAASPSKEAWRGANRGPTPTGAARLEMPVGVSYGLARGLRTVVEGAATLEGE